MRFSRHEIAGLVVTSGLVILTVLSPYIFRMCEEIEPIPTRPHLRSALAVKSVCDSSKALVVGYNYNIIRKFADAHGKTADIWMYTHGESPIDSLLSHVVDVLILPVKDSLSAPMDSVVFSMPIDSLTICAMRRDEQPLMDEFNTWLAEWRTSCRDSVDRERYFNTYSASKANQRDYLSPYDSLIMAHADTLGWDWRMLAAVIYQESRFHIEVESRRGAKGLMQMMPSTAKAFGLHDPLNPEDNVNAGVRYLAKLAGRYRDIGDNMTERFKFTIAAFNAGEGRIDDCINYAKFRGKNVSYWDNVVSVIPEMSDETILNAGVIKLGAFKGNETIRYVEEVMSIYEHFIRIYQE